MDHLNSSLSSSTSPSLPAKHRPQQRQDHGALIAAQELITPQALQYRHTVPLAEPKQANTEGSAWGHDIPIGAACNYTTFSEGTPDGGCPGQPTS